MQQALRRINIPSSRCKALTWREREHLLRVRSCASFCQSAQLNYQKEPSDGLRLGRYLVAPTHYQYDCVDTQVPTAVQMHNGRDLQNAATFDSAGFTLHRWPTSCDNFLDDLEVVRKYYDEMQKLVMDVSGASLVLIFDHKVRSSSPSSDNSVRSPVQRVHCDFSEDSAVQWLELLLENGVFSHARKRMLNKAEGKRLLGLDFAFINVWRSIDSNAPIQNSPLAVCDASSVSESDQLFYEIHYPIYDGEMHENLGLRFNDRHRWYYYPQMVKDECLIFKQYDKRSEVSRFVFHTAFDDQLAAVAAPARKSIEVRAVAFFTGAAGEQQDVLQPKLHFRKGRIVRRRSPHE